MQHDARPGVTSLVTCAFRLKMTGDSDRRLFTLLTYEPARDQL